MENINPLTLEYWRHDGEFAKWAHHSGFENEISTILALKSLAARGLTDLSSDCQELHRIYDLYKSYLEELSHAAANLKCLKLAEAVRAPQSAVTLAACIQEELPTPDKRQGWIDLAAQAIASREQEIISLFHARVSGVGETQASYDNSNIEYDDTESFDAFEPESTSGEYSAVIEDLPRRWNISFTEELIDESTGQPWSNSRWQDVTELSEDRWNPTPGRDQYYRGGNAWVPVTEKDLLPRVWISMSNGKTGYIDAPMFVHFLFEMAQEMGVVTARKGILEMVRNPGASKVAFTFATLSEVSSGERVCTVVEESQQEWTESVAWRKWAATLGWVEEVSRKRRNAKVGQSPLHLRTPKRPPEALLYHHTLKQYFDPATTTWHTLPEEERVPRAGRDYILGGVLKPGNEQVLATEQDEQIARMLLTFEKAHVYIIMTGRGGGGSGPAVPADKLADCIDQCMGGGVYNLRHLAERVSPAPEITLQLAGNGEFIILNVDAEAPDARAAYKESNSLTYCCDTQGLVILRQQLSPVCRKFVTEMWGTGKAKKSGLFSFQIEPPSPARLPGGASYKEKWKKFLSGERRSPSFT